MQKSIKEIGSKHRYQTIIIFKPGQDIDMILNYKLYLLLKKKTKTYLLPIKIFAAILVVQIYPENNDSINIFILEHLPCSDSRLNSKRSF